MANITKKHRQERRGLTQKEEDFCVYYVKNGGAAKAFLAAYGRGKRKDTTVARMANTLLNKPKLIKRIDELKAKVTKQAEFGIADVFNRWVQIAIADPADIVRLRRTCCRHCYGINHEYQYTEREFALEQAEAIAKKKEPPQRPLGGFNFNATLKPVPTCTVCYGEGVESVYVEDTRSLTGPAKHLYAGIKQTRDGLQILMRDQDEALRNIAKYLGMFKNTIELTGKNGLPVATISGPSMNAVDAAKIYQQIMSGDYQT